VPLPNNAQAKTASVPNDCQASASKHY